MGSVDDLGPCEAGAVGWVGGCMVSTLILGCRRFYGIGG